MVTTDQPEQTGITQEPDIATRLLNAFDDDVALRQAEQQEDAPPAAEEAKHQEEEAAPEETTPAVEDDKDFEWEYGGEKYVLPAKLKPITDGVMMQADYTRKTQELADHRRFVEEQAKQLQGAALFQAAAQKEFAELSTLDSKLDQFKQVDWSKLWESDPVEAGKLRIMRDEIKDAREKLASDLTQKQQSFHAQQQQHLREMIAKGGEILQREIKGWSPDLAKSIRSNAAQYGFTEAELGTVVDPRIVKMMHDAYQYRKMTTANTASKKVVTASKTLKPGQPATAATNQARQDQLSSQFRKTGDLKAGAALLLAKGLI
jgi:hypothetical protein